MKNVTLCAKWMGLVFAALFLAACSSNETKEAEAAAAAAAEQAAQETAAREAEQQAQAQAQQVREEAAADVGTVFYFDFDSSSPTDDARGQVDAHISALLGNNARVRIEGHTDERGTREYNLALGERRAMAYDLVEGRESCVSSRATLLSGDSDTQCSGPDTSRCYRWGWGHDPGNSCLCQFPDHRGHDDFAY